MTRPVWAIPIVALVLAGIPIAAQAPSRDAIEWPAPPAPARIRFSRTLTPAAVRGRPSFFSRVLTAVAGRRSAPTMSQPYGVAVGDDGRVYVADAADAVIHVYDVDRTRYGSIKVDATSLIGIAITGQRLFVTDSIGGRLLCLDMAGHVQWALGRPEGFIRPTGLVAGPDRLFVVDTLQHRVVVVSLDGVVRGTFGTRGSAPGQFNFPTNIARTTDGRLFVTDSLNFRVQIFDNGGRVLRTFGQLGDGPGDLDKPKGVAVDDDGRAYVVEGLRDVIQVFDEQGRVLMAFGGSGVEDGQLWLPTGIAIRDRRVYVADSANHRVAVFERLEVRP